MPRWEERRSKEGKNTFHLGVTDTNTNGLNGIFFMFTLKNSVTMSLAKVNLVSLPCLELKHIVSCTGRFLPKKITSENQF